MAGDGSKEWTPEWLEKLGHRFGDDGEFWISCQDLLRKYQAFERTRLFDSDWGVAQVWTTLTVPWIIDYQRTYFSLSISKPGPVVIVLSQLERYFRGLEGQYHFQLALRLHRMGNEDYLVRSRAPYRMRRSVNVELDLEAGEYDVRVKIDACRCWNVMPIEDVIRNSARSRREKLTRIGLAYDLAHGKGKIVETAEDRAAKEAYDKRADDKQRRDISARIDAQRRRERHLKRKKYERSRKMARLSRFKRAIIKAAQCEEAREATRSPDDDDGEAASASSPSPGGYLKHMSPSSGTDTSKIASPSVLSEREHDIMVDKQFQAVKVAEEQAAAVAAAHAAAQEPDEFERDPWNAVAVVGLRVHQKVGKGSGNADVVRLWVVRPSPYADPGDEAKTDGVEGKSRGLDVDDRAKDATLVYSETDRSRSIAGSD